VPSASPIPISSGNFQRGAVALAANGIAIFNPKNNTGRVSYEIGELDAYGGHCGLADDYHYHIIPTHLLSAFGGVLSNDKPVAWALDGYPIYGYVEPDGTARQALDADGGHDIGNGWGYHYHAMGTTAVDASHPYGTPQTPYLMNNFHGTVVNFGGQVDGQPEVGSIRQSGTGGYTAQPVAGASIIAFKNPVALTTDGSGHLIENVGGTASADSFLMRVSIGGTSYDECWKINRNVNPKTMTVTWRLAGATTTTTYTPTAGTAAGNRLATYAMAGPSQTSIPDTSQTIDTTATFGEDADYTIHPQSFTDNGNGTITDNVTGLMWQKTDNGESTWETAVSNAAGITTGGFTDWRLPTPSELFSIFNNNANPALNTTFFPNNPGGAAEYWWSSDVSGSSTTNVWCTNAGGGLGPKPKAETISAGGTLRYHARYVRGAKPTNAHNYQNNGDGTVTDLDTGLMWTQSPGPAMTWDAALSYAENLTLGGFGDWRLPNVKELQTLTDYTLANAASPVVKPGMNRTMFAKTLTGCITTAGGTTITCADTTGLLPGMPLVDTADIAGSFIPAATPPTVASVTSATTFTVSSGTGILAGSGITLKALAPPTAFWTSTSQNNATANAWVVEFGSNSGSTPPRSAQGIISQNVKTGTYPVFAVRTTSVATQIAVSQGGTTLTDGVSTVGYTGAGSKPFTITNTGVTSLTINSVTIDGTNAANFTPSGAPANGTVITPGANVNFNVVFSGTSAASYSAALHIDSSDTAVGAAFDVNLTGNIPVIGNVVINPAAPTNADTPYVTAKITPVAGRTISQVQLTYNVGSQTTNTVFNETMSSTATGGTGGWDGTGAVYPWTVVTLAGAGNVKQTTAANHTASGQGGTCGLELSKGSATAAQTMCTTTNAINTTGLSGSVEFYTTTANVSTGQGWIFQVSPDGGTTWNTRASDLGGTAHSAFALTHYDFVGGAPGTSELTGNLKIRFQFIGNGVGGPTATKAQIDDIVIRTVTGNPPVTVTMFDDGLHGDGAAGDGVYGVQLPAFAAGTNVTFSIAATDSTSTVTTLGSAGSYTTTLPLSITTTSPLPNALTSAAYTQSLAASGGTGPYAWSVTAGALPPGVTLGTNGTFSGTPTSAGTYNFTATVADSVGHTAVRAFSLTVKVPPNIVIIVTDDQGWADIGYHTAPGQVHIDTPTMDSFGTTASGSIRLERFYATTVCSVTRSTLLTGRNAIRTSVNNTRGLDLSEHIMPQTFKTAGYQTYMCGKWHIGGSDKNLSYTTVNGQNVRIIQEGLQYAPYNRGWDSHYGEYSGAIDCFTHWSAETLNPDHPDWWLNGVQIDGASEHTDSQGHGGYSTDLLADKAVSHIVNRDPSKPVLLYLAFNAIHGPVQAPADYLAKYGTPSDPTHYIADVSRRTIAASVDCMDAAMGRVLAALNTAGIANNTLVVWFSDNGGDETKGSLNDPLRGTKGDSWDGGMHMPAGVRWPGVLPTGVVSNQYMWVGDVFPTVCAAAGVTPQNTKPFDGLNLWPALLSASNSTTVSRGTPLVTVSATPIAIYQFTDPVNGGVKDFKIIRNKVGATVVNELYNLTDDPYETTDLSANGAYSTIITTLTSAITAIAPIDYPPYIGPPLITNSVAQGGSVTLYAPFTSYKTPTVQWRKNGVPLTDGANLSGSTSATQVTDHDSALVVGAYTTKLTLSNAALSDAGTYDAVVTNVGGATTSAAGTLSVVVGAPVLATLPVFTKGTSRILTWPAVPAATGYTVQMSATADFASVLATQNPVSPAATFGGLTSGSTYFFRATATDGITTSAFSNVVSSTQDAGNPVVAITTPANGATLTQGTVNVQGTASDTVSGVVSVTVNGIAATTSDNFANWSATVPLSTGSNVLTATATDGAQSGGNTGTASVTVTLSPITPLISSVSTGPTAPTYQDSVWVTARVEAGAAPVSQVKLTYDLGIPTVTTVFREVFSNTSTNNWPSGAGSTNLGALNQWITPGTTAVRQAVGPSNNTTPIALTGCSVNGTGATCGSTAGLWPGMLITGPGIPGSTSGSATGNTTISAITGATTFTISQPASPAGSGLTLTAAGVTLTNCTTTAASVNVSCASTAGLVNGMALSGTGLANNATVASVTGATTFTMNVAPTTPGGPIPIIATGAAAEFQVSTASTASFETGSAISTAGANSGYVEFYIQTRDLAATNNCGWALQVSSDNGATWNTRVSEDWTTKTVNLSNCVLNTAGSTTGSTTVTCTGTTGLVAGQTVAGPNVFVTCGTTQSQSTVTCTNTTGLAAGMSLQGAGIPNGTRIGTLTPNVSFTMVTGTAGTAVNATATANNVAVAATYFPANATVSSVTNGTTFVISAPAYVNTTASPVAASATTLNHGFQLFHYDFAGAELNGTAKLRFQSTGYAPTLPLRVPRVDVDDITVATTALPPPLNVVMYDDGLHGDGAAGDHIYGAAIPAQAGGTTVNFRITATDTNSGTTVNPVSGSYSYTVNSALTDGTITNAEFLTIPTDQGVTLTVVAATDQDAFVEYGTTAGSYSGATPVTAFPAAIGPIRITLTGLQPDTRYYYRLRHRNTGQTIFNARGERSFRTARPRGSSFVFTISADPHLDFNTDPALLTQTLTNIRADAPDFHIDLGDIFMTDKLADTVAGIPAIYGGASPLGQMVVLARSLIFRSYFEQTCHSVPFFFTLGNHEAEYGYLFNAAADKVNNIPYWDLLARKVYYPAPQPNSFYTGNATPKDYTGGTLGLLEDYYAWEWGDALFIVLDPFWNTVANPNQTNNAWNWSLGKPQYDWLKATLQNSSARFKFVFMHHIVGGSTTDALGAQNVAARGGVEVAPYFEWGGKNLDGSDGFPTNRPGWDMPIHQLLVQNKVNVVFHGHDHLYGYQTLDGLVYLECPQPGTANYVTLGSAADGKYTTGTLLPNSGHIRVTVTPGLATAEYVRAYRSADINTTQHNRDVSHSFTMPPRIYAPVEMAPKVAGSASFRWNAVPNKPYTVQWSPDLVSWTNIDTVTFPAVQSNGGYTDTNATRVNGPKCFYRVVYTP
jgi:arylsulfatase A-like enzyme